MSVGRGAGGGEDNPPLYLGPGEVTNFHVRTRVNPLRFLGTQVPAKCIVLKLFSLLLKSVKSVL